MKTKICLVLALLLVVTVPLCAASGVDPVQSHERIAVGESIERVSELKDDRITVVSFIVEKGEKVKLRYEVEAMEEYGDDVIAWVIMPEEVYEDGIGNWDEDDFIDFGQGPFVHRTLFLDEPNVYYFIVAVDCLNQLTISYKVELEDATPAPAPSPTPTPTPQLEKDLDGDGVPDKYDYAPYDPEVQTKSDVKTPGFGAIFAIAGLLAVAYLLRRRE